MARKNKETFIKQMNENGFNKTVADGICEWCYGTKGAGTPWNEFIDPDRLTASAYDAWTSEAADTYLNDRWAKLNARSVPKAWDGSDPLAFRDVVVDMMDRHFICTEEGGFSLYRIVDPVKREVEVVLPEQTMPQVGLALRGELESEARRASEPALIHTMIGFYKCNATRRPPPVLLGQKGEDNYCLQRAEIVPDATMPIPYWRKFLDRLNDDEAYGAYTAACYFGGYVGRQTLWISERQGQSGKSSAARVQSKLYGDRICTAMNAKQLENTHISSHFVNKKLVVAGDNNNPKLLLTGAFKEISGNDKVLVNPKYMSPHSAYLQCRVMVLSNTDPHILPAIHSQSRLLWIKVGEMAREDLDPDWEAHAEAELPGLLAWALECYRRRCPDNYEIQVNDAVRSAVAQKVRESEEEYAIPFHTYFIYTGDSKDRVSGEEFYKIMTDAKLNRIEIKNVKDWMDLRYDVSRHATKNGYVYRGIRIKNSYDRRKEGNESVNDYQMGEEDITGGNKNARPDATNQHWNQYDA